MEPAVKPSDDGMVHKPATSGDRPSTSCRYCAVIRNMPNITKKPKTFVASDVLKAGERNRPRSISGVVEPPLPPHEGHADAEAGGDRERRQPIEPLLRRCA